MIIMPNVEVVVKSNNVEVKKLELGLWGTNAYIVICLQTGNSVLMDAPGDANTVIKSLQGTNPKYILLTHSHIDHIAELSELRSELQVPLGANAADSGRLPSPPEILLNDGDVVSFGEVKLEVLHTPGHTPGSLCFKVGKYLISGDTIFPGGPGKTTLPADFKQILKSITEKILVLPDDTEIYPGHGDSTILKKEKDEFAIYSSRLHTPNLCGQVTWLSS